MRTRFTASNTKTRQLTELYVVSLLNVIGEVCFNVAIEKESVTVVASFKVARLPSDMTFCIHDAPTTTCYPRLK